MGWKKKLGIGCGIFMLLSCVVCIAIGMMFKNVVEKAREVEQVQKDLQAKVFTPPALDQVKRADMERFQVVLQAVGDRFNAFEATIKKFEEMEKRGEDPSLGEALGVIGDMFGVYRGLMDDLQAADMGFEEFDYFMELTQKTTTTLEDQAFWQAPSQEEAEALRTQIQEIKDLGVEDSEEEIRKLMAELEGPLKHSALSPDVLTWAKENRETLKKYDLRQIRHLIEGMASDSGFNFNF